jgi:hypothetical protein
MRGVEGFDILHNGMPRTFRDRKAMAYEAARFANTQNPSDNRGSAHSRQEQSRRWIHGTADEAAEQEAS